MKRNVWGRMRPRASTTLAALVLAVTAGCGGEDIAEEEGDHEEGDHEHEEGDHEHGDQGEGDSSEQTAATEEEGLLQCCELGAVCHPGPADPIDGLVRQCHDLGHVNDPTECNQRYAECLEACTGQRESLGVEQHGCI